MAKTFSHARSLQTERAPAPESIRSCIGSTWQARHAAGPSITHITGVEVWESRGRSPSVCPSASLVSLALYGACISVSLSVVWMPRERERGLESGVDGDGDGPIHFRSALDGWPCVRSLCSALRVVVVVVVDGIRVIKSGIGGSGRRTDGRRCQSRGLALQKGRRLKGGRNDEDVELM